MRMNAVKRFILCGTIALIGAGPMMGWAETSNDPIVADGLQPSEGQKSVDLSIRKTSDKVTINRDEEVTFALKVTNESRDNDVSGITISDSLTPDFMKIDVRCPEGWQDSSSGSGLSCTGGLMRPGDMATMTVIARAVNCNEKAWNTGSVWNPNDSNPSNNNSTMNLTIHCPSGDRAREDTPPPPSPPASSPSDESRHETRVNGESPRETCFNLHPTKAEAGDRRSCCASRYVVSPGDTGENFNAIDCCMGGFESPDRLACCTSTSRLTTTGSARGPLSHCAR